jgi:hypothetical protein
MAAAFSFRDYVKYAWHGSGRKWDTAWIGLVGSLLGGFLFWLLGLKVPQAILDNPPWGAVAGIVIGAITGVIFVFLLRLCWAHFHFRLEPLGGLRSAARAKLGTEMWPIVLMALGVVAFVVLFGAGFLLFLTTAAPNVASTAPCKAANSTYNVSRKLQAIDEIYAQLSGPMSDLQNRGGLLLNSFNSKLQQGTAIPELDGYATQAKTVFQEFNRLVESYNYFRDIYDIIIRGTTFAYNSSESASLTLVNELHKLYNTLPHDTVPAHIENNTFMDQWKTSILGLATWISQKEDALRQRRREYEAMDICG